MKDATSPVGEGALEPHRQDSAQRGDERERTQETRYKVLTFDLTAARTEAERIGKLGNPIATVAVIGLPAGAAGLASLRIGEASQDFIPLNIQGQEFRPAKAERAGLFLKNAAGAFTLTLLVSFEEAPLYTSI